MLACWDEVPEKRPLFDELEEMISNMMEKSTAELYILLNEPYLKMNATHLNTTQIDYSAMLGPPDCQATETPSENYENIQQELVAQTSSLNAVTLNAFKFFDNPIYYSSDA